jgi:Transposase DDE domain
MTEANGTAERTTALDMIEDNAGAGSTIGGDKAYDTADLVAGCRERGCTPHVAQNDANRRSAIDARTTRHPGYRISTIKRKQIEEPFGWIKTVGGLRKARHRGRGLVEWFFSSLLAFSLCEIWEIWPSAVDSVGIRQRGAGWPAVAGQHRVRIAPRRWPCRRWWRCLRGRFSEPRSPHWRASSGLASREARGAPTQG